MKSCEVLARVIRANAKISMEYHQVTEPAPSLWILVSTIDALCQQAGRRELTPDDPALHTIHQSAVVYDDIFVFEQGLWVEWELLSRSDPTPLNSRLLSLACELFHLNSVNSSRYCPMRASKSGEKKQSDITIEAFLIALCRALDRKEALSDQLFASLLSLSLVEYSQWIFRIYDRAYSNKTVAGSLARALHKRMACKRMAPAPPIDIFPSKRNKKPETTC